MLQGIALSLVLAVFALAFSTFIPLGAVVIAIILGMLLANIVKLPKSFAPGITYAEKSILAFAIATLGINLDFSVLAELGYSVILIIVLGMIMTIYSTLFIASKFGIDKKFALILGIGNGVCGASAIGSAKDIVKVKPEEAGIAVAVVNFLGTIGMFLIPFIALTLGLNENDAGILAGNTLQAVGQAVAGGFAISDSAGENATIVKMGRVLMLTPLIVILLMIFHNDGDEDKRSFTSIIKNVPQFIVWFIFFSIVATFGVLPEFIEGSISTLSKYALIIAMAAIGMKITLSSLKQSGKNALIVGSIVFSIQIIFTLILLSIF